MVGTFLKAGGNAVGQKLFTITHLPDCESDPFITPTQLVDRPQPVDVHRPQPADRPQSTNKASTDQVPAMQRQVSSTLVTKAARQLT